MFSNNDYDFKAEIGLFYTVVEVDFCWFR